ncbi:hypothetical protein ACF1BN_04660 [Streptomyces sp. NPDC014861]|uniref:hypothetical protein n=1 Tax=Streptomyces sp. NPDC014861 TaxID=3364923 RepID=UPI0037029AE7
MARMRRGLVHALAWSLATGAAVTLSWWGVHTVLSGTVYDPPRALPLPVGTPAVPVPAETAIGDPVTSSTRSPATTPPATTPTPSAPAPTGPDPAATTPPTTPPPTASRTTPAPTTVPPAPAGASSGVKSYPVDGGRVTFDLGESSAELVSAIPASGWQMQVWKQTTWIRVTFTRDDRELSVFCLWHDSAPRVQIEERAV